jgi:hypothetical protein
MLRWRVLAAKASILDSLMFVFEVSAGKDTKYSLNNRG